MHATRLPVLAIVAHQAAAPFPDEWIPNEFRVDGGQLPAASDRYLDTEAYWSDPDRLSAFEEDTAYRMGTLVSGDNNSNSYYTDATFLGRPRLVVDFLNYPSNYLERRGIFGNRDYSLGSMRGEDLQPGVEYRFQTHMAPGALEEDTGSLVGQFGIRFCRFSWCGIWLNPKLMMNPEGLALEFPGNTDWKLLDDQLVNPDRNSWTVPAALILERSTRSFCPGTYAQMH